MRFLFTADLHGGTSRYSQPVAGPLGSSRLVEFEAVLDRLGTAAIEAEVGYVFVAGDLFDHRHPTPAMLRVWTTFCARMVDAGIKVLMVPGNHDGAAAIGDEATHTHGWMAALHLPGVIVYTRPTIDTFDDLVVVAFPYPHRRALDGTPGFADTLPEERVIEGGARLGALIQSYGREAREEHATGKPLVFLGHMTVLGSRTASERLMRMEWDVVVGPEAFEAFDFVALGHIHKMQGVGPTSDSIVHGATNAPQPRIWYAGSPVYLDFTEAGNSKGFLLVELEMQDGRAVGSVIPVRSNPRNMVRARLEYIPAVAGAQLTNLPENFTDAIVELTITGTERPPESWVQTQERAFRAAGVHILKTKIAIEDRATIPALVTEEAIDLTDKVRALARHLREQGLPEEPYVSAARGLIEALNEGPNG